MKYISKEFFLNVAEIVDAFRVVPRLLIIAYVYLIYYVVKWYMELKPYIIEKCESETIKDCIASMPTTQHAALVTAVVSIAAAVFGLYTATGRKWLSGIPKPKNDDRNDIDYK